MIEFYFQRTPRLRVVCNNAKTYRFFWPFFFTRAVPGARRLSQWASRRGAGVHGALRLEQKDDKGCVLTTTRPLQAGVVLISVPLELSFCTNGEQQHQQEGGTFRGHWDTLEEFSGLLVRALHDQRSPHSAYAEFLHDLYNADAEEDELFTLATNTALAQQVERLHAGNALNARGVRNGPFLAKDALQTAEARVNWVRTQDLLRRLEQSLPYFGAKSAAWGLSMALSRGVEDDDGGLAMYPLIDFCSHSYRPNAVLSTTSESGGVQWRKDAGRKPCMHLVAKRDIEAGEEVTMLYSPRGVRTAEDREYWRMRWGFVPNEAS